VSKQYNPYEQALCMLTEQLDLNKIKLITDKKDPDDFSIPEKGFDVDILKAWLKKTEVESFRPQRSIKQYCGYEILQCLRKSYYLRQGAEADMSKIGQYPFSKIKAVMGNIVERLLLSMYNECVSTKYINDVKIKWNTDKELGLLYPFVGAIDGLSYDKETMLDVKFTNQYDDFHIRQVKLYMLAYQRMKKRKNLFQFGEVVYINSEMNAITTRRFDVNDNVKYKEWPLIEDRMKYYDNCLRENIIPTPEKGSCNFCVYEKLCKANDNTIIRQMVSDEGNNIVDQKDKGQAVIVSESKPKKSMKELKKEWTEMKMKFHPRPQEDENKKDDSNLKILL